MKLASFRYGNRATYGAVTGDELIGAPAGLLGDCPTLADCIAAGRSGEIAAGDGIAASDTSWLPPIPAPARILCIGINYRLHVEETGRSLPDHPAVFLKLPDALVGHEAPIRRPKASPHFDYEGELALVIGKAGRNIAPEAAMDHVFGWSCFNDGSIRDFQKHSVTAGKNFTATGSFGPWIVPRAAAPPPEDMILETRVNGNVVQRSGVDMLIFDISAIISYLSTFTTLEPGDVIATGTPSGVGARRDPPLWLKPGDRVEVEISGVGCLGNPVEEGE